MKDIFKPGDVKVFEKVVAPEDTAAFAAGEVHPVYATFALARDAEWACRLFVIEMKEEDEEGIGTRITIDHLSPAMPGSRVRFTTVVKCISGNEIVCSYEASVGERLIARGEQGQRILKKEKIRKIFGELDYREKGKKGIGK